MNNNKTLKRVRKSRDVKESDRRQINSTFREMADARNGRSVSEKKK
jgi:hypothetical protein